MYLKFKNKIENLTPEEILEIWMKDEHWASVGMQAEIHLKRKKLLTLLNSNDTFYCQREIEGERECDSQCEHCKQYYKPLGQ